MMTSGRVSEISDKFALLIKMETTIVRKRGIINTIIGYLLLFLIIYTSRQVGVRVWPQNIENKNWFFWTGAVFLHYLAQIWTFLFMLPGYLNLFPSIYEKHKINKRSTWPWQRPNWKQMRTKLFYSIIINQGIIFPLLISLSPILGVQQRFDKFPSFSEICVQIIILYYLDEMLFYWGHRAFHQSKNLYKMHKLHHEYDKVFTFATQYTHPFEYIITSVGPGAIGLMILGSRAHCFTYFFWICFKVTQNTEGHSGYQFLWSPFRMFPFIIGPAFHDHHHSVNVGNYSGSCYLWDLLMNTGEPFFSNYLKQNESLKKPID